MLEKVYYIMDNTMSFFFIIELNSRLFLYSGKIYLTFCCSFNVIPIVN